MMIASICRIRVCYSVEIVAIECDAWVLEFQPRHFRSRDGAEFLRRDVKFDQTPRGNRIERVERTRNKQRPASRYNLVYRSAFIKVRADKRDDRFSGLSTKIILCDAESP